MSSGFISKTSDSKFFGCLNQFNKGDFLQLLNEAESQRKGGFWWELSPLSPCNSRAPALRLNNYMIFRNYLGVVIPNEE